MAVTNRCQFPHDLNFAIKQLDDDLGSRFIDSQNLLKDAETSLVGMDDLLNEGNNLLDELLSKNGVGTPTASSLTNGDDVINEYGLLPYNPTIEQSEKFLGRAGIILIDGIWYLSGERSNDIKDRKNIEALRRLYFSLGNDLKKTDEILKSSTKTIFVTNNMTILTLPKKGLSNGRIEQFSYDDVRVALKQDQLTQDEIAYTADGRTLVLTKPYVCTDLTIWVAYSRYNVQPYNLVSNIFHLDGVDSSTAAVSRYMALGYTGNKLNSILDGNDYLQNNVISLSAMVGSLQADAAKIITVLDFIEKRMLAPNFDIRYAYGLQDFYSQVNLALSNLLIAHQLFLSYLDFQVSPSIKKNILDLLREKHTDEKIKYLLERRQDVEGIYFNPPDDVYIDYITRTINAASPNSTTISNNYVNNRAAFNPLDKKVALNMYASLIDAQTYNAGTQNVASVRNTKEALKFYINLNPFPEPKKGDILQGQPSTATPSSILTPDFDVPKSMGFDARREETISAFKDLADMYPSSIAGPLADVINAVVALLEKACKGINTIIAQAEKTLFNMKKKLDTWLSKHASLTGQGDFSSSLFKCAVNWDIGASTDLLDMLFDFLMKFVGMVTQFLSKLQAWIANILTKLLCMPVNILNSFLGKLQVALPSACRIPKFDLGAKLNDALSKLNNVCAVKGIVLNSFSKDLAKIKMVVSAAPDRLGQFRNSALCESSATANFMNASVLNVSAGVGL